MNSSFEILILKLNGFIRKYYKNQVIRGLLISLSIILFLFLTISVFEYYSWSSAFTRQIIYYSFLAVIIGVMIRLIAVPLANLARLGKTLSHEEAAHIIGRYFPQIGDKLINTLQLKKSKDNASYDLLIASIEQKANELKPLPFKNAVTYKTSLKYLRFFVPITVVLVLIWLVAPAIIYEPTERIINHQKEYFKPLPYSFKVLNNDFSCAQHDDYTVIIEVSGDEIPAKIWVEESGYKYRMSENHPSIFEYTFKDVVSDLYFSVSTADFQSNKYHVNVFPVPVIYNFNVDLVYPSYLQMPSDNIENTGDLIVPAGTTINWSIFTRDTENVFFIVDDSIIDTLVNNSSNVFKHKIIARNNLNYSLVSKNEFIQSRDTMSFNIQVIKDEFPSIIVNEYKDETSFGIVNFTGTISDDHGFHSLNFVFKKDSVPEMKYKYTELFIDKTLSDQYFDYMISSSDFNLLPGDQIEYYFEVRDNDSFNGFKRTKSEKFFMKMPEKSDIENKIDESSNELRNTLENSLSEINKLNKEVEQTTLNLFEKKSLSWSDKQLLADLLNKKENIKKQLDEIKKLNEEINELEKMLKKKLSPELQEKLKQLEELMNQLLNEDLQEDLEKLKEELKKENIDEFLNKMKEQNEELKNDIEQNLELYKQFEFEQLMEQSIEKLKQLAKDEKALSEETANKQNDKAEGIEKQQQIKESFDKVMEQIKKADQLNSELEDPYNIEIDTSSSEQIEDQMDEAQSNMEKGKQKKASENQKNAGEKMEEMANALSFMMQAAMEEQMGEDIEQVKKMLDNLLDLSFAQENLIDELKAVSKNDPKIVQIREDQKDLLDDFGVLEDSLLAMSKRQVAIKPFVIKETKSISEYIIRALSNIQESKHGNAAGEQQYALTSMNNLSLMLAESLDQMQQSMQMSGSKKGSKCKNPGKGKSPSLSEIMKQQKGLNQGMQGKMKKNGKEGKEGINGKSEELARMAAMQGEIRRMLQDYIEQLESEGGNGNALNKLVEEMKKSEDEIINRQLNQQTIERQKNIETRLLKSQKAIQEREKEKKRESKEGKNPSTGNQKTKLEYKNKNERMDEIIITTPIEVKPYYRKLLKEYLYKLENDNKNGK